MRFKTMLRYGLLAAATAAISVPASSFGIGLQPTTVEMTMEPGQRQRQVVTLGNVHQEKTISLTLGLADWTLDEQGQIKLAPPGEREDSASEWVRFSPAFITLEPGEKEQIVVDMAAPIRTDREGDFRFALIASTILPESRSGQSGVWKKYQIASLFYLTMGDAASTPEITASALTLGEDGSQSINLTFENAGNAHARLRGEVEITGDSGDAITMPINNLVVLHEGKREFGMPLKGVLPSNPKIKVKLENTYAPQTESGLIVMEPYKAPLVLKQAAIEPTEIPAETIIDEATSLE
jgi:P pilus assembly chaperone PapD